MHFRATGGRTGTHPMIAPAKPQSVQELVELARIWAQDYYQYNGKPTRAHFTMNCALDVLVSIAGQESPRDLRAEHICACQQLMIGRGMARRTINDYVGRIKTALTWAARPPQRWIPAEVLADLKLAENLKPHRSKARESHGVRPVPWERVSETIAASDLELATLIELHWWTGARPSEVVNVRKSEIRERDGLLVYSPQMHKSAWRGKERHIVIGPNGRAVLEPWSARVKRDRLFRFKSANGYFQAVRRINRQSQIPHWCPAQIRHSYLTRVGHVDLDGARAAAGHSKAATTEIYIERDISLAIDVQRRFG